jgi:hypothetical protein
MLALFDAPAAFSDSAGVSVLFEASCASGVVLQIDDQGQRANR